MLMKFASKIASKVCGCFSSRIKYANADDGAPHCRAESVFELEMDECPLKMRRNPHRWIRHDDFVISACVGFVRVN